MRLDWNDFEHAYYHRLFSFAFEVDQLRAYMRMTSIVCVCVLPALSCAFCHFACRSIEEQQQFELDMFSLSLSSPSKSDYCHRNKTAEGQIHSHAVCILLTLVCFVPKEIARLVGDVDSCLVWPCVTERTQVRGHFEERRDTSTMPTTLRLRVLLVQPTQTCLSHSSWACCYCLPLSFSFLKFYFLGKIYQKSNTLSESRYFICLMRGAN